MNKDNLLPDLDEMREVAIGNLCGNPDAAKLMSGVGTFDFCDLSNWRGELRDLIELAMEAFYKDT